MARGQTTPAMTRRFMRFGSEVPAIYKENVMTEGLRRVFDVMHHTIRDPFPSSTSTPRDPRTPSFPLRPASGGRAKSAGPLLSPNSNRPRRSKIRRPSPTWGWNSPTGGSCPLRIFFGQKITKENPKGKMSKGVPMGSQKKKSNEG